MCPIKYAGSPESADIALAVDYTLPLIPARRACRRYVGVAGDNYEWQEQSCAEIAERLDTAIKRAVQREEKLKQIQDAIRTGKRP